MRVQDMEPCQLLADSLLNGGPGQTGDQGDVKGDRWWDEMMWDDSEMNPRARRHW